MTEPGGIDRLRGLDHRRGAARRRAALWFLVGCAVTGLAVAAVALVVTGIVSRAFDLGPSPVVVAAAAFGLAVVVMVIVALRGLRGASDVVLAAVAARPFDKAAAGGDLRRTRFANVVDELVLGLGLPAPALALVDDPAPNALSVRQGEQRTLVATTGLLELDRDELEAVCAHELAHLYAVDARWIAAADASVARARAFGLGLMVLGFVTIGLSQYAAAGLGAAGIGFGTGAAGVVLGIGLAILGGVTARRLTRVLGQIRVESDAVADVAAVLLARNPVALGSACDRLAADAQRLRRTTEADERLWFKLVPAATTATVVDPSLPDDVRSRLDEVMAKPREVANRGPAAELHRRADAAYLEAGVPRPGSAGPAPT